MSIRKLQTLALLVACAGAGSAWSASFPSHHAPRTTGCPIYMRDGAAVELNFTRGEAFLKSSDGKSSPAPDGVYVGPNGEKLQIQGGRQVEVVHAPPADKAPATSINFDVKTGAKQ